MQERWSANPIEDPRPCLAVAYHEAIALETEWSALVSAGVADPEVALHMMDNHTCGKVNG